MVIKLWDGFVRGFHWLLVVVLAGLWYTGGNLDYLEFNGNIIEFIDVHHKLGLIMLALIITRILWGIFGSSPARFSQFLRGPKAVWGYLKSPFSKEHLTHNPGGGLIVVLMLVLLLAQAISGLFTDDAIFFRGPLANTVNNDVVRALTSYHKQAFDFILILIALHIVAIFVYLVMRKNFIGPMITGKKTITNSNITPPKQLHGGYGFILLSLNLFWIFWWLG
ncbi:cytochrome b [Idiomarina sp. A28L]|uniref:cytochrome b/b6 domain-containing protein n=1 Tax=Idiomarina sp. A28L TaxID=1036674 RepID=UPI0002138BCA|nr:cytochrome b/b6 domain-containing protein [Idiomarina sp. A28L]EGN74338.1 cytochrome b [Idiomarina sp. A28L]